MRSRNITCSIVACLLAIMTHAADKDLERQLKDRYKGKGAVLQHFYRGYDLHFDSHGELVGKRGEASWAVSRVLIKKINLKSSVLRIEGERVGDLFDKKSNRFRTQKLGQDIKYDIQIEAEVPAGASAAEVSALMEKIFFTDEAHMIGALPPYWRGFFEAQKNPESAKLNDAKTSDGPTVLVSSESANSQRSTDIGKTAAPIPYRIGSGIKAPHAVYTPDPEYEEMARRAKIQGTCVLLIVVDREGKPQDIRITRPIGFGLDDKAVAAVSRWRFEPATFNGTPVPVLINIEVNFWLY